MKANVLKKVLGSVLLGSLLASSSLYAGSNEAPTQKPLVGIYADNFLDS